MSTGFLSRLANIVPEVPVTTRLYRFLQELDNGGVPGTAGLSTCCFVDPGAPGPGVRGSLELAGRFKTIQAAINAALDGDAVVVAPGTYVEDVTIPATLLNIVIQGIGRPTIINAMARATVLVPRVVRDGIVVIREMFIGNTGPDACVESSCVTPFGGPQGTLLLYELVCFKAGGPSGAVLRMSGRSSVEIANCAIDSDASYFSQCAIVITSGCSLADVFLLIDATTAPVTPDTSGIFVMRASSQAGKVTMTGAPQLFVDEGCEVGEIDATAVKTFLAPNRGPSWIIRGACTGLCDIVYPDVGYDNAGAFFANPPAFDGATAQFDGGVTIGGTPAATKRFSNTSCIEAAFSGSLNVGNKVDFNARGASLLGGISVGASDGTIDRDQHQVGPSACAPGYNFIGSTISPFGTTIPISPPFPAYVGSQYIVTAEPSTPNLSMTIVDAKTPTAFDFSSGLLFPGSYSFLLERF